MCQGATLSLPVAELHSPLPKSIWHKALCTRHGVLACACCSCMLYAYLQLLRLCSPGKGCASPAGPNDAVTPSHSPAPATHWQNVSICSVIVHGEALRVCCIPDACSVNCSQVLAAGAASACSLEARLGGVLSNTRLLPLKTLCLYRSMIKLGATLKRVAAGKTLAH